MLDVVLEVPDRLDLIDAEWTFNPCCAGCSSGRASSLLPIADLSALSILVVLDVVLEVLELVFEPFKQISFNPCCAGCSSGSISPEQLINDGWAFNPCCAGCSSGRHIRKKHEFRGIHFQSLLCWM